MNRRRERPAGAGAYGFELAGAAGAATQLVTAEPGWPTLEIQRLTGASTIRRSMVGADRAEIVLVAGDQLILERAPLRATFTTRTPLSDDALIHPYLAPAAAIAGYWLGREAFHAGAFVIDHGVWAVLGDKGSGKSSLLAWLAQQGHGIFADDALVLEGAMAFAGPRSIDLRAEPATRLAAGEPIGVVGDRERWRLELGQVAGRCRLRGWVFLGWGESVELTPVSAGVSLQQLFAHRMIKGLPPPDPGPDARARGATRVSAEPTTEFRSARERRIPARRRALGHLTSLMSIEPGV